MARVTAKKLFTLPNGKHPISSNLFLLVRNNSRSYVLRYSINGKRHDKSIGSASKIGLSEARAEANRMLADLARGNEPVSAKDQLASQQQNQKGQTFAEYAERTIDKIAVVRMWSHARQKTMWINSIRDYVTPIIGDKLLSEITKNDVLACLSPIWKTKTETASRVRGRLENIFSYAVTDGYMQFNPALWRGNLDRDLPPPNKIQPVRHYAAMPLADMQDKISCFYPANNRTRQVILFTILTASRVGESVPAMWSEIDWDNRIWMVPPERRKDRKPYPHRVPLSDQAIELLKSIEPKGDKIFCFDKANDGSKYSLAKLLKKMTGCSDITMHGFRSTFRDWAAEKNIPDLVSEKCLMHASGNAVVQAYQRSDLLEQRRPVMQQWADTVFAKVK